MFHPKTRGALFFKYCRQSMMVFVRKHVFAVDMVIWADFGPGEQP